MKKSYRGVFTSGVFESNLFPVFEGAEVARGHHGVFEVLDVGEFQVLSRKTDNRSIQAVHRYHWS